MKTPLRSSVVRRKPDALGADAMLDCDGLSGSEARSTGSYSSVRLGRSTTISTGMRMASMDADTDKIAKAKPNRAVRKVSSGANNDAARACSVQRPTHSQPTASVEPRCDDDVDRCAAHSGPPNGHHGERRINMPGARNKREQHHSARHRDRP